jgi:hypothetical protein
MVFGSAAARRVSLRGGPTRWSMATTTVELWRGGRLQFWLRSDLIRHSEKDDPGVEGLNPTWEPIRRGMMRVGSKWMKLCLTQVSRALEMICQAEALQPRFF